jgi:hypothetical protein
MTHGDKTKANPVKSGKASGKEASAGKSIEIRKASAEKGSGKASAASGSKAGQNGNGGGKASGIAKAAARAESSEKSRARAAASEDEGGISNPAIASSLDRAIKKYPNAFRKLND